MPSRKDEMSITVSELHQLGHTTTGHGLFCKELLWFDTTPRRRMPALVALLTVGSKPRQLLQEGNNNYTTTNNDNDDYTNIYGVMKIIIIITTLNVIMILLILVLLVTVTIKEQAR